MDYDGAALSFGGGLNSSALAVWLVEQGWRGHIVLADTGAEKPETYCWLDYFEREYLAPHGLTVTRLRGLPWQREWHGQPLAEYCERLRVIPLYAVRWCSLKWKREPIARWCEAHGVERQLLGIAADESWRRSEAERPLVEAGITREDCRAILRRAGLPEAPRSSCWFCPSQTPAEWRQLWERHPELYERAARMEEAASAKHGKEATFDPAGVHTLRDLAAAFAAQARLPWGEGKRDCVCEL